MSTGAYQAPTTIPQPAGAPNSAGYGDLTKKVEYECGECSARVKLGRHDPVRCDVCGHRVLYKLRTNRMVQFVAR